MLRGVLAAAGVSLFAASILCPQVHGAESPSANPPAADGPVIVIRGTPEGPAPTPVLITPPPRNGKTPTPRTAALPESKPVDSNDARATYPKTIPAVRISGDRPTTGPISTGPRTSGTRRSTREIVVASIADEELTLPKLQRLIKPRLDEVVKRSRIDRDANPTSYGNAKRAVEEQVVAEWLINKAMTFEARREKIEVTPADIDAAAKVFLEKAGQPASGALEEAAKVAGLSVDDFRETLADALYGDRLTRKYIETNVSEEMLKQIFEKQASRFSLPRQRRYEYLVIEKKSGVDPDKQKDQMSDALRRAKKGADFKDLAKRIDMNKEFKIERLIREDDPIPYASLHEAIWETKVGEVSDLVESLAGFHIVKVIEEIPPKKVTFEECRETLLTELFDDIRPKLGKTALKRLSPLVHVETHYLTELSEDAQRQQILESVIRERAQERREQKEAEELKRRIDSAPAGPAPPAVVRTPPAF